MPIFIAKMDAYIHRVLAVLAYSVSVHNSWIFRRPLPDGDGLVKVVNTLAMNQLDLYPSTSIHTPPPVHIINRFHFTTGKFPFEGENVYKLFGAISTGVFEMPADLSPHLQDLLKGMLRKDAEQRFSMPEIRTHPYVFVVCVWHHASVVI